VTLDLMIHVYDLVLALVRSPVLMVDAVGAPSFRRLKISLTRDCVLPMAASPTLRPAASA